MAKEKEVKKIVGEIIVEPSEKHATPSVNITSHVNRINANVPKDSYVLQAIDKDGNPVGTEFYVAIKTYNKTPQFQDSTRFIVKKKPK
jgi:hypothetical protein